MNPDIGTAVEMVRERVGFSEVGFMTFSVTMETKVVNFTLDKYWYI